MSCIGPTKSQPEKIEIGLRPFRQAELSDEHLARIQKFHETFLEVFGISLEITVKKFKRETNPEREIVVRQNMAEAYTK